MGQKVNPFSYRLSIRKEWKSVWCNGDYSRRVADDYLLRSIIEKKYKDNGITDILIERTSNSVLITIKIPKSSSFVRRKVDDLASTSSNLSTIIGLRVEIRFIELDRQDVVALFVAKGVCKEIELRKSPKKVMQKFCTLAMKAGAMGVKIRCSGRISGAEIARSEACVRGSVPLHTIRANIDYAVFRAYTTYGVIGVKVWINRDVKGTRFTPKKGEK